MHVATQRSGFGGNAIDAFSQYAIPAAVWFDGSADCMTFTPNASASQRKATVSFLIQRLEFDVAMNMMGGYGGGTSYWNLVIESNNALRFYNVTGASIDVDLWAGNGTTPSQWEVPGPLHIVLVMDTENATETLRLRVWVNGVEVTDWMSAYSTYPTLNKDMHWGGANIHRIGGGSDSAAGLFEPGKFLMSDFIWVDNQALTADDFGEFDPAGTGKWRLKDPETVVAGMNAYSCYLPFDDASELGDDESANTNDWTLVSMSSANASAMRFHDSFPVFNEFGSAQSYNSNGSGLSITPGGNDRVALTTMPLLPGKKNYFEGVVVTASDHMMGIAGEDFDFLNDNWAGTSDDITYGFRSNGTKNKGTSTVGSWGSTWATNGKVIGVKVDLSVNPGSIEFLIDNVSQGVAYSDIDSDKTWFPSMGFAAGAGEMAFAFAEGDLTYSVPSGYETIRQSGFAAPAILDPRDHMTTRDMAGNGSTQSISDTQFQPDLCIAKAYNLGEHWECADSVRGATVSSSLSTHAAEATSGLASFDSAGVSINNSATNGDRWNNASYDYHYWLWKASAAAGFDIVTWTGDGLTNRNISHSLGAAPEFAILLRRDGTSGNSHVYWWHAGLTGDDYYVRQNALQAQSNSNSPFGTGNWSSTQFMVSHNATHSLNISGATYVAYIWRSIPGFSRFGSYTGQGAQPRFINLGFMPELVWILRPDGAYSSFAWAHGRETTAPLNNYVHPNGLNTENASGGYSLFQGVRGFYLQNTYSQLNASAAPYIYCAWGRQTPGGLDLTPALARFN